MKNLLKISVAVCMLYSSSATSQIVSRGEAINKAGKQRMLTMKMAKNYMAIGANVRVAEAKLELEDAATMFNENYNDLAVFIKYKEASDALLNVGTLWAKFRNDVNATPSAEMAPSIIQQAYALVNACSAVVDKYVANTGAKVAVLPNVCGKQRMYSQRLGMLYIAKYWQVAFPTINKDLAETGANYENGLTSLLQYTENTDEINTILRLQKAEWEFTKKFFEPPVDQMAPTMVYSSTNLMTRNFETATTLYAKLVN